jgi:RNA polymerase sigma factor (sigma-70 family)
MADGPMSTLLRHLRRLAGGPSDRPARDGELLDRFLTERDEPAFAALVRRHGPMVQGVCRSVLHHWHDAEDAFQATFLVLARKAASIRHRDSIAGWLHEVAYHLAVKSLARGTRRRAQAMRSTDMPAAPVLDLTIRDLQRVLHEELQRLDEKHRAPLVLCYLEGKTHQEAARQLGWTAGTVRGRLNRGRELLRGRLTRRGLALSAGLFTVVLSQSASAAAPPAAAADALARAAVIAAGSGSLAGVVAPQVATLVQGISRTMFVNKTKVVLALLLLVGAGTAGTGLLARQALAARQATAAALTMHGLQPAGPALSQADPAGAASADAKSREDRAEIRGQVVDPRGNAVAGARLHVVHDGATETLLPVTGTTGKDGRFTLRVPKSATAGAGGRALLVVATADGFGADWATFRGSEVRIRLLPETRVRGRILDHDGRPVSRAQVSVVSLTDYSDKGLTHYLNELRSGEIYVPAVKGWYGPIPGAPQPKVGPDGRFVVRGVGRDWVVRLRVVGRAIEHSTVHVMARVAEPVVATNPQLPLRIYGARFDYVARASRPIRGVVRDRATGKPLAGVEINGWGGPYNATPVRTGPDGRYELTGVAKAPCLVQAGPPQGRPYFQATRSLPDTPGFDPLTCDFDLVRGIVVRGRVTDRATGKPVPEAVVRYNPLAPNPNVRAELFPLPETRTAADGSYHLVILPGPGLLQVTAFGQDYRGARITGREMKSFFHDDVQRGDANVFQLIVGVGQQAGLSQEDCHALVLLNPATKESSRTRDVALERGRQVKGSVTDQDGKPLTGVVALGLCPSEVAGPQTLKTSSFTVRTLHPQRTRRLLFLHEGKKLGALVDLRGDTAGPVKVRLQRCGTMTGRVVDRDGQPMAGLVVQFYLQRYYRYYGGADRKATTDRDGRFRIDGLVAGEKYGSKPKNDINFWPLFRPVVVKPGETKDLGEAKPHQEKN